MLIIGHLFQFPPGNYEAVETTHCSCREKLRIFQPPKTSDILKHPQHTVWPLTQGSSKATAIDCSFLVWFCAREMGKFTHQREREKLQKRERERVRNQVGENFPFWVQVSPRRTGFRVGFRMTLEWVRVQCICSTFWAGYFWHVFVSSEPFVHWVFATLPAYGQHEQKWSVLWVESPSWFFVVLYPILAFLEATATAGSRKHCGILTLEGLIMVEILSSGYSLGSGLL